MQKTLDLNIEKLFEKIKSLILNQKFDLAIFLLNSLNATQKDAMMQELENEKQRYLNNGHKDSAIEIANFLKKDLSKDEKRLLIKAELRNGHLEYSEKIFKELFPECSASEMLEILLELSAKIKS
ncbi:MAG: hypothetical protein KBD12_00890 [Candidatus Pacebacteria bacterium]|nr:hypothetical protein [Candidatus Paceibacterota bacterium]